MSLHAQTIAEKKAGLVSGSSDLDEDLDTFLTQVNKETDEAHAELDMLYARVQELYKQNACNESFQVLLQRINDVRSHIEMLETSWREVASKSNVDEPYALWHQPDTSLGQLVIDYGSHNYVYLIPPEVAEIRLNVDSNLPIPRSSWDEMLELILTQNGVGIKQLNPFLRQLYLVSEDHSNLKLITNKRKDLEFLRPDARICFILTPSPSEVRRTWAFLDKFINPNTTTLQMIGREIIIIAQVAEVQDLLKLNDFVETNRGDKDYRIVPLWRVDPNEMARILSVVIDQSHEEAYEENAEPGEGLAIKRGGRQKAAHQDSNGLKIIPLSAVASAIFLIGTTEEIKKAEDVIKQVEYQVGDAREKVIYWYAARHSDAAELADVLYKIYYLMIQNPEVNDRQCVENPECPPGIAILPPPPPLPYVGVNFSPNGGPAQPFPRRDVWTDGFYLNDGYVVDDGPVELRRPRDVNANRDNFIVDVKTGSIVMVVEADILPKMKELLKKLDVPKKMVQIEVLLFEKRTKSDNEFGLNLLKIGEIASQRDITGFLFNDIKVNRPGVSEFFISRKKADSGIPAFDAVYKFLLTQDDIQINANPSILTINQTLAKIAIEDEISVNTGVFQVETNKGVTLKDGFQRARYGIKMEITPSIHLRDPEGDDPCDYVTLKTDVVFETIHPGETDRPDVTRRLINNETRIADGQTVILGGLRRKVIDDRKEVIPFLGELPGIGKLFGITKLRDNTTEMFIFITPKIIDDPCVDLERIRQEELCRRPGDTPEFLCCLLRAQEYAKNRLLHGSLTMLLGRPPQCDRGPCGEYDGR